MYAFAFTRWLSLENGHVGLQVQAHGPLEFSACHFTPHDLYAAKHTYDLKPLPETFPNLNFRQSGLGAGSCGPGVPGRYQINPGTYQWAFTLRPFLLLPCPAGKIVQMNVLIV